MIWDGMGWDGMGWHGISKKHTGLITFKVAMPRRHGVGSNYLPFCKSHPQYVAIFYSFLSIFIHSIVTVTSPVTIIFKQSVYFA